MFRQQLNRIWKLLFEHVDLPLLLIILAIMSIGLATVYSATHETSNRVYHQLMNMVIGMAIMLAMARCPPQKLMRFAVPLYLFGICMLVAVFLFGISVNGAKRWLSIGITRIQPAEVMKIAMPMMLAWYFSQHENLLKLRHFFVAGVLVAIPFLLIAKQPDLGTSLLILASGAFVVFMAGLQWRWILGAAAAVVPIAVGMWYFVMHDYQKRRVLTFLNPESDPLGAGWNIIQSKAAIGSGGVLGKGWLLGTQSHLDFLPESHTDFIIAVLAEEFGLVGVCLLLLLYLLLLARGLVITAQAQTLFGKLLAGALTMTFFVYVFVNIGMVSGLLPVVGVPLPFISYGGTHLVTLLSGFGILMAIHTHRKWIAQV